MRKAIISCACYLFFVSGVSSQEYSINGVVKNSDGVGVQHANIVLVLSSTSELVKGTSTDNQGSFSFSEVETGSYTLTISFLGFENYKKNITVNQSLNLGRIILKTKNEDLPEVVIVGEKPTIERIAGGIVFNVGNTTAIEGNTWELLSKTPTLIVSGDELLVKGKTNPVVYINDRRLYLTPQELQQMLNGLSANIVESVEVITNPSARYDADAQAVVNIKTSKNIATGYSGNAFASYTQGFFGRHSLGSNHFFKTKNIDFSAGYSFSNEDLRTEYEEDVTFIDTDTPLGRWLSNTKRNTEKETHNINTNIDVRFNKKNKLGFSALLSFIPYKEDNSTSFTQAFNIANSAIDSTFAANNRQINDPWNIVLNARYIHDFDKEGHALSSDWYYVESQNSPNQDVLTRYFDDQGVFARQNRFTNLASQENRIYAGKIDYELPLKKNVFFEAGAKLTRIDINSKLNQTRLEGNSPQFVDNFNYEETNWAGYLNFNKKWARWELNFGVRGENTSIKGNSLSTVTENTQNYFEWFPTFYLQHKFNENHDLVWQYSRSISRPDYDQLNPFRFFYNDNSFEQGNPDLLPELENSASIIYTHKTHSFELNLTYSDNPIYRISFQDNINNQIQYIYSNISFNLNYSLEYYSSFSPTSWWDASPYLAIFKDEDRFQNADRSQFLSNSRWGTFIYLQNTYYFNKKRDFSFDLNYYYQSPLSWGGTGVQSENQSLDVGLRKVFQDGRLIFTITGNDILGTFKSLTTKNRYLDQNHRQKQIDDLQYVKFNLRFNFGNTVLRTNEKSIDLEERERLD